jgi:hypothetical protein
VTARTLRLLLYENSVTWVREICVAMCLSYTVCIRNSVSHLETWVNRRRAATSITRCSHQQAVLSFSLFVLLFGSRDGQQVSVYEYLCIGILIWCVGCVMRLSVPVAKGSLIRGSCKYSKSPAAHPWENGVLKDISGYILVCSMPQAFIPSLETSFISLRKW